MCAFDAARYRLPLLGGSFKLLELEDDWKAMAPTRLVGTYTNPLPRRERLQGQHTVTSSIGNIIGFKTLT
jgi:hypothetical protein